MAQMLTIISIIAFVIAGLTFCMALFFWFRFRIPSVIGDLTGRTAQKSIAMMRQNNEQKNMQKQSSIAKKLTQETTPLAEDETTLLASSLGSEETSLLVAESMETTLLREEENATTLLAPKDGKRGSTFGRKLIMIEEVVLIHTSETIV